MRVLDFIREIEQHTGKPFSGSDRKQVIRLQRMIDSHYAKDLQQLSLFRQVANLGDNNALYNDRTHNLTKRRDA